MIRPMSTPLPVALNRLVASNLAAQSAEQLSLAAVPIVAVLALGAGPGEIGALATAQTLPFLLLSIPFGLWADRSSRRRLMAGCELLRGASLLGLLLAVLAGQLSLPLLAMLGFIGAVGTVGYSVAAPALLPALVPSAALAQANSRLELARSAAFAAGPALAGALVAWAGGIGGLRAGGDVVRRRGGAAAAAARAGARTGRAAPPAAGAARRRTAGVAAPSAAADPADRRGLEHRLVRAAGGLRALCDARTRPGCRRRRLHAGGLRQRHGGRRAAGAAHRGAR